MSVSRGGGAASGGPGASVTGGVEVINVNRISDLEGRSGGVGADLGFGPNLSGEVSASEAALCTQEVVGVALSAGVGFGAGPGVSTGVTETSTVTFL